MRKYVVRIFLAVLAAVTMIAVFGDVAPDSATVLSWEMAPPSGAPQPTVTAPSPSLAGGPDAGTTPAASCPEGMALVEGDYCFEVKQECLRSAAPKKVLDKRNPGQMVANPEWENNCFSFRPGVAECSVRQPQRLTFRILRPGQNARFGGDTDPKSSLGASLIGKATGDKVWGCTVSKTSGSARKDVGVAPGSTVTLTCPAKITVRSCVDKYEYPNQAGQKPMSYVSFNEGAKLCAAVGKRLCYEHEWEVACQGTEMLPYPYGWKRDSEACNISGCITGCKEVNGKVQASGLCRFFDQTAGESGAYVELPTCPIVAKWMAGGDPGVSDAKVTAELYRLDHATGVAGKTYLVPSGSYGRCVSPFGVWDMTGNLGEWTQCFSRCESYPSNGKGGHNRGYVRNRCQPVTVGHGPDFKMHSIGFRCCKDATPK